MKLTKLIFCMIVAFVVGMFFILFEAITAIPYNVTIYIRDKFIPAYVELFKEYNK